MPWSLDDYPVSMRHLSEVTRAKAIEIANALLAEGMEDGRAIRIATARAEEWGRAARVTGARRAVNSTLEASPRGARHRRRPAQSGGGLRKSSPSTS